MFSDMLYRGLSGDVENMTNLRNDTMDWINFPMFIFILIILILIMYIIKTQRTV